VKRVFKAQSTAWLVAHDLRVALRTVGQIEISIALLVLVLTLIQAVALFVIVPGTLPASGVVPSSRFVSFALIGGVILFALAASSASLTSINLLFQPVDFDLLFSSPIPRSRLLAARLIALVVTAAGVPMAIIAAVANAGMIRDSVRWIWLYPLGALLLLVVVLIVLPITFLLVRWLGVRRAQGVMSMLGVALAAGFYASQHFVTGVLDGRSQVALIDTSGKLFAAMFFVLSYGGWSFPLLLAGLFLVALGCRAFAAAYSRGALRVVGGTSLRTSSRRETAAFRERALWWTVAKKEWRTLWRDQIVLSRVLLQVVPLAGVLLINVGRKTELIPLVVGVASALLFVARPLLWLFVVAEEAPDLVYASPQRARRLKELKAVSAVTPLLAILIVVSAFYVSGRPLLVLVCVACAGLGFAQLVAEMILRPLTGQRGNFQQSYGRNDVAGGFAAVLMAMGYAICMGVFAYKPLWAPLGLVLVLPHLALILLSQPPARLRVTDLAGRASH
jgi:ABC-2 type transport system permease protein